LRVDVVTIFPAMFESPLAYGIVKRAQEKGALQVRLHDLRDYTDDRHRQVDDTPYGGGAGMVMMPGPFFRALAYLAEETVPEVSPGPSSGTVARAESLKQAGRVVLLTPQGRTFSQAMAWDLAAESRLVLLCGRYEGVDARVEALASDLVSTGDYILSGGELAAMVIIDAVARLLPGVLGGGEIATAQDSFAEGLLEYPQYTRPEEWAGLRVPEVLLSGHHGEIMRWRREQSLIRTLERRPDLLKQARLSPDDFAFLKDLTSGRTDTKGFSR